MAIAQTKDGDVIKRETEIVDNHRIGKSVGGIKYPAFLNSKNKMLEVARKDRIEFSR